MNLPEYFSFTNILANEPPHLAISVEVLLAVMQNYIKLGLENYAVVIG